MFPKSTSDVQYIYRTSDIYIRISDVRYPCPSPSLSRSPSPYPSRSRVLYISHPIYILDVRYIYWMSNIDFGGIGVILSQTVPHNNLPTGRFCRKQSSANCSSRATLRVHTRNFHFFSKWTVFSEWVTFVVIELATTLRS